MSNPNIKYTPRRSRKGIPNKLTCEIKELIETCYHQIGGIRRFAEWADGNPTEFYKLWAKLLPKDIIIDAPKGVTINWPLPKTVLDK